MSAKLFIKWILIKADKNIVARFSLNEGITVICKKDNTLLIDSISLILGKRSSLNKYPYDITILSGIKLNGEIYYLRAKKKTDEKVRISINKKGINDNIEKEYFSLISHNKEEERLTFFSKFKSNYTHRIGKYLNGGLNSDTDGYINTRIFRQFLGDYIRNFEKIRLHSLKHYYLSLDRNGEFKAVNENGKSVFLSETENILYNFYCFASLNELWCKAEKIRNFNHVVRPIIVSGFLERVDMSIDLSLCIKKMKELPNQIIMVAENEKELERIKNDIRNE